MKTDAELHEQYEAAIEWLVRRLEERKRANAAAAKAAEAVKDATLALWQAADAADIHIGEHIIVKESDYQARVLHFDWDREARHAFQIADTCVIYQRRTMLVDLLEEEDQP